MKNPSPIFLESGNQIIRLENSPLKIWKYNYNMADFRKKFQIKGK